MIEFFSKRERHEGVMKTFAITDIGQKRSINQDFVYTSELPVGNLPNLFLVADGMGGHQAGDVASKYTVEQIVSDVESNPEHNPVKVLRTAIEKANEGLIAMARSKEELTGMGTTLVAATIIGDYMYVANVGDSRLYVLNETITQITRDHSLVEEMVRNGAIDRLEARFHPKKNIITRAIGVKEKVMIDFFDVKLKPKDTVLLCSDGLTNMVEDEDIHILINQQIDIAGKAEKLIETANQNGGKDNITVVVIEPFSEEVKAC